MPHFARLTTQVTALALVLFGVSCATSPTPESHTAPRNTPQIQHTQRLNAFQPARLPVTNWNDLDTHVRITPDPVAGQLHIVSTFSHTPETLTLQMPFQWAGHRNLHRTIRNLKASCDGRTLTLEAGQNGQVTLRDHECASHPIQIQYSQITHDPSQPTGLPPSLRPQLNIRGALFHGQASLLVPYPTESWPRLPYSAVEVVAPESWTVAANWTPVSLVHSVKNPPSDHDVTNQRVTWRFVAEDLGHMQDSIVVGGDLRVQTHTLQDGRTLQVTSRGQLPVDDTTLAEMAIKTTDAQRRYLPRNWVWPAGTRRLTMIALGEWLGTRLEGSGRRGGFIVEVGQDSDPIKLAELIAHEAFHAVNGHLLVHHPDAEYDTLWFKEGVTTYIAAQSVVRAGLADERWFRARMSAIISSYYGNPQSMKLPAHKLLTHFWTNADARRLPYDKGALLGLILDNALMIDADSPGLDRLWRELLKRIAAQGKTYTNGILEELAHTLNTEVSWDVASFWERFVHGTDALPLRKTLGALGLKLERNTIPVPYFGFQIGTDARGPYISAVDGSSPAARSGLRRGDRLAEPPDIDWNSNTHPAILNIIRGGGVYKVLIHPKNGHRTEYALNPLKRRDHRYLSMLSPQTTAP